MPKLLSALVPASAPAKPPVPLNTTTSPFTTFVTARSVPAAFVVPSYARVPDSVATSGFTVNVPTP